MKKFSTIFFFLLIIIPFGYSSDLDSLKSKNFTRFTGEVIQNKINIRSDSTPMAASLGTANRGDRVKVIGQKYEWYKISLPKKMPAYVWAEYVKKISIKKGIVNVSSLNLRSQPSIDSYAIGKLQKGDSLHITAKAGDWYRVRGDPYTWGWINKKFVQEVAEIEKKTTVKDLINLLGEQSMAKKKKLHQQLIAMGPKIISSLEASLPGTNDYATFSLIHILSEIIKKDPMLTIPLLQKVKPGNPIKSGIYLDIIQEVVQPQKGKEAYFCYASEGRLTDDAIVNACEQLSRLFYRKININKYDD
ncbi:MAG: SH3 domain-containing protein [Candidatus Omnitrophica bacterium]|nr:SH3 domain-containing protein [Candidatus Omnitrophota bacterium]